MSKDHLCIGIEREKNRYYDAGYESVITINQNVDGWSLNHILQDRLSDRKVISAAMIDIYYCPFCGNKLED